MPSLPKGLLQSLRKLDHFNEDAFQRIHESGDQTISVHFNPAKSLLADGKWNPEILEPPFELASSVPWAPDAYYLKERPSFTRDPFFHAGNYYVQEASGMFLAQVLKQITDLSKKINVLDLCAAPGGKSTMIQSLISSDSLLVSNEVIKTRIPVLYQNMTKWGSENSIVSNNDPSHFKELPGFFDVILIDAPCSGSGLYRKDPEAAAGWSSDLVNLCSHRQQRILEDVWSSVKENGWIIYSTCSYSKEENEDILDALLRQHDGESVRLTTDDAWNIVETKSEEASAYGYRFYPDRLQGEGFFIAVIRKKEASRSVRSAKSKRESDKISAPDLSLMKDWIGNGSWNFVRVGDAIHAMPSAIKQEFESLSGALYLKKAGIRMGKAGDKTWIPDHELAMASTRNSLIPCLDIHHADALQYLRGEPFETGISGKGWQLITFQHQALGWAKLLDKRMNNYYPKSWRIRL